MANEQWRTGLINITLGSQTVIGTASCDWVNQVSAGHVLKVDRDGESTHTISTIVGATRIVLNANYGGTTGTGLSYIINRSFSANRGYWRVLAGDADFAEILSQDTIDKIDTDIANIIAGNASVFRTSASRFIINYDGNAVRLNASLLTASRDYTFPDQNATLAGLSVAQTFTANQTVDASLWVKGNASIDGNLAIGGNFTISEINVTSSIIGQANASIDGDLAVGDDVIVGGKINVTSSIIGQGNASINGALAVGGNLSVTGDFYVGGSMIVTSSVLHKGDNIFGDQDSDNHKFFGTTTASGGIFVAGSIIGQANASIDGALSVGGNIIVAGNVDGVDVAALSSNVGTANASIDALQTNMINANASIDALQTNMVNANASIDALQTNMVNANASVALNTASIIHHTTNITRANASIDALQANVTNANASISINETNITVANASIDALQLNMINANASIDTLQTNMINTNASIAARLNFPGAVIRPKFRWKDGDELYIGPGMYHHQGTSEQAVYWDEELTFQAGPVGSNASSSILCTASWFYLYIHDKAVVADGVQNLAASHFVMRKSRGAYNATKHGEYMGNDRCIFGDITGASVLKEFFHNDDTVWWADKIENQAALDIDLTFVDIGALIIPAFAIQGYVSTYGNAGNALWWRTNGQTGTVGHAFGHTQTAAIAPVLVLTDSAQVIEIKCSTDDTSTFTFDTEGWNFPTGM